MSKKYIEVDKLTEMRDNHELDIYDTYDLDYILAEAPAADVEKVVTGQWVTKYNEHGYHKECSVCGARWMLDSVKHICVETPRCYNCGAKLEKEGE